MSAHTAVIAAWVVWYATWVATVVWSSRTKVQMGADGSSWHRALATVGILLLFVPSGRFVGSAPLWTEPAALAGAALVCVGFAITARIEEGFLRAQLGAEAYDAYSRRVPMLVPSLGFRPPSP